MKDSICKSQRQVVIELVTEYIHLCKNCDELERIGINIDIKFFNTDNLLNWALDIIGFPQDTVLKDDSTNEKFFCREYLTATSLLNEASEIYKHDTVEEYIEFLYTELENLKKENPQIFL